MNAAVLDSNLIIYGARRDDVVVAEFLAMTAFYASEISLVETLGYHRLSAVDQKQL